MYGKALDNANNYSSYWWLIPKAWFYITGTSQGVPQLGAVAPGNFNAAPNNSNSFWFSANDPNGWGAINQIEGVGDQWNGKPG